jgi:transposase InsO family protein
VDQRHHEPDREWIARQITEAFPWDQAPRHLLRGRDRSYGAIVRRRLQAMGIRDHPTAPRSPWQNGHVERLIASIRRECLDHIVVVGEVSLHSTFKAHARYFNEVRTHRSLERDTPETRPAQFFGLILSRPVLGGLHHHYVRV